MFLAKATPVPSTDGAWSYQNEMARTYVSHTGCFTSHALANCRTFGDVMHDLTRHKLRQLLHDAATKQSGKAYMNAQPGPPAHHRDMQDHMSAGRPGRTCTMASICVTRQDMPWHTKRAPAWLERSSQLQKSSTRMCAVDKECAELMCMTCSMYPCSKANAFCHASAHCGNYLSTTMARCRGVTRPVLVWCKRHLRLM